MQTNLFNNIIIDKCDYKCLIGDLSCYKYRECEDRKIMTNHINRRYNSLKSKSINELHIDPPLKEDIALLMMNSLNNGLTCKYCNIKLNKYANNEYESLKSAISLDHIISSSMNKGNNKINNLQIICHRCNVVKSSMFPDYFEYIVLCLKNKYGIEGLNKYLNETYRIAFAKKCNYNANKKYSLVVDE